MKLSNAILSTTAVISLFMPLGALAQSPKAGQRLTAVKDLDRALKNLDSKVKSSELLGAKVKGLTEALKEQPKSALGGMNSGGGDPCESRIKVIRDDFKSWISQGGPQGLRLPKGISLGSYILRMSYYIDNAKVACVSSASADYPVQVQGTPKVCRFDRSQSESRITCESSRFSKLSETDQYVLIHHEYAGLADIERPNGDDSNYEISNQISDYLVDVVVKKLAIKPQRPVDCLSINVNTAPIGTKCETSAGAIFERVERANFGVAWKGPDGLVWSDIVGNEHQLDAINLCRTVIGGRLPTRGDFEKGEMNGFREALPEMGHYSQWTSTSLSGGLGWQFYSGMGEFSARHSVLNAYVRCVGK